MAHEQDLIIGIGSATPAFVANGTAGLVLTANGAGVAPTYQAASASGSVTTLTGDTGGAISPTAGNINIDANPSGGSSVSFSGSGSTLTLNTTDSNDSVIIGLGAGNGTITGTKNTGMGRSVMSALTTGDWNTSMGYQSLQNATNDRFNCAFGGQALQTLVGSGGHNTALGIGSLQPLITGSDNVCVGYFSGFSYTGAESSNILIGPSVPGTTGESNTIRIGSSGSTAGLQDRCFIAGIASVSVSNLNFVTINTSTGQLGSTSASGFITAWTDVTGATQTLAVNNGYFTDRSGGVTYTLPATATLGDNIRIDGKLGLATVAQNANQAIRLGSSLTTTGVTGSLTATNVGDCLSLRCSTAGASTIWVVESSMGNWTVA